MTTLFFQASIIAPCLAVILHAHMLQNFDKVLEQGLSLLVGDYSCCDVTKDMRAAGLNRIQIAGMKNKCINFAINYCHSQDTSLLLR